MLSSIEYDQKEANFVRGGLGPVDAIHIASDLWVCAALIKLNVNGNPGISGEAVQQLAAAVLGSKTLEVFSKIPIKEIREDKHIELDLSSKGLGPTEGIVLAALIQHSPVLKSINLRYNRLGTEGWCAMFLALRDNKANQIQSWDLRNENINPEIVKALAEYVAVTLALNRLVLTYNRIKDEGAIALSHGLMTNKTLKVLYLNECDIGTEGGNALAAALSRGAKVLTECNVRGNHLDSESAHALAKVAAVRGIMLFGTTHDQKFADFNGKGLGPVDAILIASDLWVSKTLTSLDLSNNQLCSVWQERERDGTYVKKGTYDPTGIQALASALGNAAVLNKIVLSHNLIKDEGAIAIGAALKINKTLKDLELDICEIHAEGGKALASALSEGRSALNSLYLGGNRVGSEGAKALADALRVNAVLTELDVEYNSLSDKGKKALRDAAKGREGFELVI